MQHWRAWSGTHASKTLCWWIRPTANANIPLPSVDELGFGFKKMHCNSAGSKLPVSTPLAERNSNPKVAK
jgi:hypothetical protein